MHREYDPTQMRLGQAHSHEHPHADHAHSHDPDAERRVLIAATSVVGLLLAAHLITGFWAPEWQRPWGIPLALLAAVIGGGRIIFLALAALFEGRVGADIALAIACVAAALAGEYFVAAEVVFIALLGECLEAFAFGRAQRAIQGLLDLRPKIARILREAQEVEIPVESLAQGNILVVRPGERIAADGTVVGGHSAVDQAALTGEGMPVDKAEGDAVYTGTVNQFGRLEIRAEKVGAETTLGQVLRLLDEAQRKKAPLHRTADRYARLFLPAVLIAAGVIFCGTNLSVLWNWARSGQLLGRVDVLPSLAVLVVACPCALILATPAAVLAATARLARRGVLIKNGAALERLAQVDTLAFDKTGTLTEGRPELADIVPVGSWNENELLRLAATAERSSEHPLARMLVAEAGRRALDLTSVEEFQAHPGAGVEAHVRAPAGSSTILVGNLRLFRLRNIEISQQTEARIAQLDEAGQTTLLVAVNGQLAGIFGARDRVRREAHDVIHDLKHLGLKDQTILTGDRPAPARAVAKKVHLKQVEAELTPVAKAEWIQRRQHEGRVVAMIGDGINDAPALAVADVGIALGGVGADIAAEAGSIVLMGDPLTPLPHAVQLSRQTVRIIRQNILIFAFGLNAFAVLLAGLRVLGPVAAAIVHQVGSLLVLLNAIRLLGLEHFGPIRAAGRVVAYCRRCRPSVVSQWSWHHRRRIVTGIAGFVMLAYLGSNIIVVGPEEIGVLRRWGRYRAPLLEPGLHVRWPSPWESVTTVEPALVRVARVGLSNSSAPTSGSVAWNAPHGGRRDESALFLTGDESLVELAAVVEYHYPKEAIPLLLFGVASAQDGVQAAAEAAFREAVAKTSLNAILVGARRDFEAEVRQRLNDRLGGAGLPVAIDRVRVVDAHPPREVVPAYRDVSTAVSDAERFRNDAEGFASERKWSAIAEARARRDLASTEAHRLQARAEGEKAGFLARRSAHAERPDLTEFRLLWDAFALDFADRPKILLDPHASGRRHIWLADPERFGLERAVKMMPAPEVGNIED
jgi:heavy metal translocating P-type ATPase